MAFSRRGSNKIWDTQGRHVRDTNKHGLRILWLQALGEKHGGMVRIGARGLALASAKWQILAFRTSKLHYDSLPDGIVADLIL